MKPNFHKPDPCFQNPKNGIGLTLSDVEKERRKTAYFKKKQAEKASARTAKNGGRSVAITSKSAVTLKPDTTPETEGTFVKNVMATLKAFMPTNFSKSTRTPPSAKNGRKRGIVNVYSLRKKS